MHDITDKDYCNICGKPKLYPEKPCTSCKENKNNITRKTFLSLLAIGLPIIIFFAYKQYAIYDAKQVQEYEIIKGSGCEFKLQTRFNEGKIYIHLETTRKPKEEDTNLAVFAQNTDLASIGLIDKEGFEMFSENFKYNDLASLSNKNFYYADGIINCNGECKLSNYRKINNWTIKYRTFFDNR